MKKVALSLLAFALVGAMAFGQDAAAPALKIGGYLDIGTATVLKDKAGKSTIIKGDDSGVNGGSYVFKLAYGTDKAGLVTKTRLEDLTAGYNIDTWTNYTATNTYSYTHTGLYLNPQAFYAWFLVPGAEMVKVYAGNNSDDGTAWNQLDDKGDKQTAATGFAVEVTPAEGLSLGGGVVPKGSANALYSVGATYTVPATVQIAGALLTGPNKDGNIAASNFAASFKLLLDGPLAVKGGVNLYGMESDKQTGYQITDVTLGYAITDAFSAGLNAYVFTYGSDLKVGKDSAEVSYKLTPSVGYVVDPVTKVGIEMTYKQGAADKATVVNKLTTIDVKPNATFTIDPQTKVLVYYDYTTMSGDAKPADDASYSTISVEARYSF